MKRAWDTQEAIAIKRILTDFRAGVAPAKMESGTKMGFFSP
ncbi:MAG: hypothetical protein WCS70_00230 [Verrucomicrobiota bacterium]|jgi:hypothetical protein